MNCPAKSGRSIKELPHKAKMFATRGGKLNPKEIKFNRMKKNSYSLKTCAK
jgi:hypothetical protein